MIIGDLIDALVEMFYKIVYKLFSSICLLIDFIKTIFFKLCGIETVEIEGESTDLLTNLLGSNTIKNVFLTVTIIGFILLILFTIIAIVKSNYQEKQTWKTAMSKSFQGLIIMLIVPVVVMAGILLTNTIMTSINQSMQSGLEGGNGMIGGQFLVTIGSNSFKGTLAERSQIESMFISGQLDYNNLSTVQTYYDITSMNYIIGLLGGLVILIMFVLSSLTFVQRIFDVVLLYIISPVSISTIPLDEGNRFKVWKDMLISKILSAYGIILVMNLFFLIIPQVYKINFFNNSFNNGVVYILFLIGGSFAVTKANRLISQLCGGQQTGGEMATLLYNIRSGIAFTRATSAIIGGATAGLIAGSDYKNLRKKKKSRGEALNSSLHSTRNQKVVQEGKKKNKAKQVMGAPLRMATMPVGMLHDLSRGGLIQVGKNFMPRLKNAFAGDSLVNRAEVKRKKPATPEKGKDEQKKDSNDNDDLKNNDTQSTNTNSDRENESIMKDSESNKDGSNSSTDNPTKDNPSSDTTSDREKDTSLKDNKEPKVNSEPKSSEGKYGDATLNGTRVDTKKDGSNTNHHSDRKKNSIPKTSGGPKEGGDES